jgi:hypothetical protein
MACGGKLVEKTDFDSEGGFAAGARQSVGWFGI